MTTLQKTETKTRTCANAAKNQTAQDGKHKAQKENAA